MYSGTLYLVVASTQRRAAEAASEGAALDAAPPRRAAAGALDLGALVLAISEGFDVPPVSVAITSTTLTTGSALSPPLTAGSVNVVLFTVSGAAALRSPVIMQLLAAGASLVDAISEAIVTRVVAAVIANEAVIASLGYDSLDAAAAAGAVVAGPPATLVVAPSLPTPRAAPTSATPDVDAAPASVLVPVVASVAAVGGLGVCAVLVCVLVRRRRADKLPSGGAREGARAGRSEHAGHGECAESAGDETLEVEAEGGEGSHGGGSSRRRSAKALTLRQAETSALAQSSQRTASKPLPGRLGGEGSGTDDDPADIEQSPVSSAGARKASASARARDVPGRKNRNDRSDAV